MSVKVVGTRAVMRNLEKVKRGASKALGASLFREGLAIHALSARIVPRDEGILASTGKVVPPGRVAGGGFAAGRDAMTVAVQYGGSRAPYAVDQHERLDYRHTPPQSAKYLEIPFMERQTGLKGRVTSDVRRWLDQNAPRVTVPTTVKDE